MVIRKPGWEQTAIKCGKHSDNVSYFLYIVQCFTSTICTHTLTHLHSHTLTPSQLLEFLSDSDETTADSVLVFVREAVQTYPQLKSHVVAKLLEVFSQIKFLK